MVTPGNTALESELVIGRPLRPSYRAPLDAVLRFLRREPLGAIGATLFRAMILVAVFAPLIAPHDPLEIRSTLAYRSPGAAGAVRNG